MIRRLSRREKNIFIICLGAVLIYTGHRAAVVPFNARLSFLDRKIEAEERKLNKNLKILQKSQALEAEYNEYLSKFKQDKSNEQVMSAILAEIEQVAGLLDLHISDLKPKIVNRHDFYNRFSVSLTIDSEFVAIIHFLYILQNEPHLFSIEELRIDNGIQRDSKTVKTNLVLSKIYIP